MPFAIEPKRGKCMNVTPTHIISSFSITIGTRKLFREDQRIKFYKNHLVKSERGRCIPRSLLLFDCIPRRTIGWEDLSRFLYRGVEYIAKSRQTL